ncbi:MAG: hypothetical protein Q9201_000693 [Fulgogasparrea decipioides]
MNYRTFAVFSVILTSVFLPLTGGAFNPSSASVSASDAVTLASITQLLSLFSLLLDIKDFDALSNVYTNDAVIVDAAAKPLTGLPAIKDFYRNTFQNASLITQHTSNTVYGYNFSSTTASSVSYAEAVYFGPAVLEREGYLFSNSSVVFREKFENDYVKESGGAWKISHQKGPLILSIEGDLSILPPF